MTATGERLNLAASRLAANSVAANSAQVGGLNGLIVYRSQLRLSWMATCLHLFTIIAEKQSVSAEDLPVLDDVALEPFPVLG